MLHRPILTLCAALILSACHGDSSEPAPVAPQIHTPASAAAPAGPTVASQTAGMVEAVGQGKSSVPAQFKFEVMEKPQVGKTLTIEIALLPQVDASSADIQINASDGFDPEASKPIVIPSIEAGMVYRQGLKVTPITAGVLSLAVTISLRHDEVAESRVFSIPIIVEH